MLSAASLAKMISPTKTRSDYAMGVYLGMKNGHKLISHIGGVGPGMPGLTGSLFYFPEDKLTVVVLANRVLVRSVTLRVDRSLTARPS